MKFEALTPEGLFLIHPDIYHDNRGYFEETYNRQKFADNGIQSYFVQDNLSFSAHNVLRGLHLQLPPFAQDKLVRATTGRVLDVAIDARPNSPTFLQYRAVELSDENNLQFFIPRGFFHGFLVLSDQAHFEYKVSRQYDPPSELALNYNDPDIDIRWPVETPILSSKDAKNPYLVDILPRLSATLT